jgi:hypothetical protein
MLRQPLNDVAALSTACIDSTLSNLPFLLLFF